MEEYAEVDHVQDLSDRMERLLSSGDCSDITFVVEEGRLPAHRLILAASCDYFRVLLFGGLRESHETEVVVKDAALEPFKLLLRYIYTGVLTLKDVDTALELLGLSHKYGLKELQDSVCQFLSTILSIENVCAIYEDSKLFGLEQLSRVCLDYIDKNAKEFLESDDPSSLPTELLSEILSRDSFSVDGMKIVEAALRWIRERPDDTDRLSLMEKIRLDAIAIPDLLTTVRNSKLISPDRVLQAIVWKGETEKRDRNHGGAVIFEENVATLECGAKLLTGKFENFFEDTKIPSKNRECARHCVNDREGITVDLGTPFWINRIVLELLNDNPPSSSYYVEVSVDCEDWRRVIDRSGYICRYLQNLFFQPRVCRYIRVVGTRSVDGGVFHLCRFEAMFTEQRFKLIQDICVPEHNVAKTEACVIRGHGSPRGRCPQEMIDGNFTEYDEDCGYTWHEIGSAPIVVQLAQPYIIGSIGMLLWDGDNRAYSYYIETSVDGKVWTRVVDRTEERCRSWQILPFEARPVCFIKIVGTPDTANRYFQVVHFECPSQA